MKVNMIFTGTVYMVEREPKIISGSTWDWTLTFAMTGRNALSIELIKLTGEQAIVSYVVSGHRIGHPLLLRWLDSVFFRGYHPTLKLSGIPTFTFIVSLTHRMDNI